MSKDVASNIVQIQTILEVKAENLAIQSVSCLATLLNEGLVRYVSDLFRDQSYGTLNHHFKLQF